MAHWLQENCKSFLDSRNSQIKTKFAPNGVQFKMKIIATSILRIVIESEIKNLKYIHTCNECMEPFNTCLFLLFILPSKSCRVLAHTLFSENFCHNLLTARTLRV